MDDKDEMKEYSQQVFERSRQIGRRLAMWTRIIIKNRADKTDRFPNERLNIAKKLYRRMVEEKRMKKAKSRYFFNLKKCVLFN